MSFEAPKDVAISVRGVAKSYRLFEKPSDRFWQMVADGFAPLGANARFYREIRALKPVSFDLIRGETIAIIGLNGAGKSTLLQTVCGTLEPSEGEVRVNGRIAALLELGAGFNPDLTGRQNVEFGGLVLGMTKAEIAERFAEIEAFADIGEFIDYPVSTYSTGMYVRLAFSLAIHCEPEILVVDEALSVGDFMFQQKCNRFLRERLNGVTKLLVTHDMGAVTHLAHRVLLLHHGELIFDGSPRAAIERYQIVARAAESKKTAEMPQPDPAKMMDDGVWFDVPEGQRSGRGDVRITRVAWSVASRPGFDVCRNGERVRAVMEIKADKAIETPIYGFQAQDRFGNVVFGNNSKSAKLAPPPIAPGRNLVEIAFDWPLVIEGKYSITLGVGEGDHALSHVIQCWAHNIFVVSSVPTEEVHGVFNAPLQELRKL